MIEIYTQVIYRPILNLLVGLYNTIPGHDIGLVIVLVTLAIRLLLAPFMHKSLKGQKTMSAIQPKIHEIKEKHKEDKQAQAQAMMDLYKEHNISPFSSCLPLLIQLPILIALFQVFSKALKGNLAGLYSFVSNPGVLNPKFMGLIDLSHASPVFAIIAGVAQYLQSRMVVNWQAHHKTDPTTKAMNIQAMYILPIFSIFIAWKLPAGLPLYWIVTTLFSIGQQYYIEKTHKI